MSNINISDLVNYLRGHIRLVALIVIVVALLIANVMLFLPLQDAQAERDSLEKQEKVAQVNLDSAKVEYDIAELEAQVAELEAEIILFEEEFPYDEFSIYLAKGADTYHITIGSVTPPSGSSTLTYKGKKFPAYSTKMSITGRLSNIISYFKYIEQGRYNSVKITGVSLSAKGDVWSAGYTITFTTEN